MPVAPTDPPTLLPTPRSLRLTGDTVAREPIASFHRSCGLFRYQPDAIKQSGIFRGSRAPPRTSGAIVVDDSALAHEAYTLSISPHELRRGNSSLFIRSNGPAGIHHAIATLGQLLRVYTDEDFPCLEVEDSPGFATRGVMLDVSRDKVPTMDQLRRTIDLLASLKFNHLQFYTEHTFAYAGHEEVWRDWSPITPGELRELDTYAAAREIEIAANQNCFGHLSSWLKKPGYQHLAEIEGDGSWFFHQWERRGPFSLCPVEARSEAFVADLLGQLLPCLQSGLVNIGCDETFDVGWGRSKAEVDRRAPHGEEEAVARARAQLYFEFVQKIAAACKQHGKRPMMWADIALTHPEMLDLMPREMIGLAWWYEPTSKFADWVGVLKQHGHEAWVCPGTSSWRTFTGRTAERRANIADAAEQGAKTGATGLLVCDWGDVGHRQQWPISLAGLAQAAEAAWNPSRAREYDARATALHVLGEQAALGPWLEELGDCDLPIRKASNVRNASALFNDMHPPVPGQLTHGKHEVNATSEQWRDVKSRLENLIARRPPVADERTRAELDHAQTCAAFAADHAIAVRSGPSVSQASDLIARAEAIRAEHERLWLGRNRPGGMAHASSFYTKVIEGLRTLSSAPAHAP